MTLPEATALIRRENEARAAFPREYDADLSAALVVAEGVMRERPSLYEDNLIRLFEGHYWDSFEKDKDLILAHVRAVLNIPLLHWQDQIEKSCPSEAIPSRSQEEKPGNLPDQETFWLIERRVSPPQYTTSDTCLPALSNDPWRAVRFKSKGEAFGALLKLQTLRDECCVIEHIFINKRPAMMDSRPASAAPLQGATIAQIASVIEGKMFAAHELPLDPELHERYLDTALAVIEAMRPQDQGETRREASEEEVARSLHDYDFGGDHDPDEVCLKSYVSKARALLRSFHITPRS